MTGDQDRGAPARLRHPRRVWLAVTGVAAVGALAFLLHELGGADAFSGVTESAGDWAYAAAFLMVLADAIFPVFPGETALSAASTLAAAGHLELPLVMLVGAAGAIVGDSTLYWIARAGTRWIGPQLDKAKRNDKVEAALALLGANAPLLIVLGRYVPGLRFVVNASMGLSRYPYRRFLPWSILGGVLWSVYTCGLAYWVGTALADFPLASVVISFAITTVAVAAIFVIVRRRARQRHAPPSDDRRPAT